MLQVLSPPAPSINEQQSFPDILRTCFTAFEVSSRMFSHVLINTVLPVASYCCPVCITTGCSKGSFVKQKYCAINWLVVSDQTVRANTTVVRLGTFECSPLDCLRVFTVQGLIFDYWHIHRWLVKLLRWCSESSQSIAHLIWLTTCYPSKVSKFVLFPETVYEKRIKLLSPRRIKPLHTISFCTSILHRNVRQTRTIGSSFSLSLSFAWPLFFGRLRNLLAWSLSGEIFCSGTRPW